MGHGIVKVYWSLPWLDSPKSTLTNCHVALSNAQTRSQDKPLVKRWVFPYPAQIRHHAVKFVNVLSLAIDPLARMLAWQSNMRTSSPHPWNDVGSSTHWSHLDEQRPIKTCFFFSMLSHSREMVEDTDCGLCSMLRVRINDRSVQSHPLEFIFKVPE